MKVLRLLIVLFIVFSIPVMAIHATCTPSDTGTAGNDNIDCTTSNPPAADVQAQDGDDTITIGAGVVSGNFVSGGNTGAAPESGNDLIINDGSVVALTGDSWNGDGGGNDVIVNNNNVVGSVLGDSAAGNGSGNDIIVNNGTVGFQIYGDTDVGVVASGNDT